MWRSDLILLATTLLAGGAGDGGAAAPAREASVLLAAGRFSLPAANSFGDRGFHEVLSATHLLSADLDVPPGVPLIVSLRDAGRPGQSCARDHPLSGCATVDWSDFDGRPGVPPGGVFDNHVTIALDDGPRTLFLGESDALADVPDAYSPG